MKGKIRRRITASIFALLLLLPAAGAVRAEENVYAAELTDQCVFQSNGRDKNYQEMLDAEEDGEDKE